MDARLGEKVTQLGEVVGQLEQRDTQLKQKETQVQVLEQEKAVLQVKYLAKVKSAEVKKRITREIRREFIINMHATAKLTMAIMFSAPATALNSDMS